MSNVQTLPLHLLTQPMRDPDRTGPLRNGAIVSYAKDEAVLFADPQGRLCNKALNVRSQPNVWMAGTLPPGPDEAPMVHKVIEEPGEGGGRRGLGCADLRHVLDL